MGAKKKKEKSGFSLQAYKPTFFKALVFIGTGAAFFGANYCYAIWNMPSHRYAGTSPWILAGGIASTFLLFSIPYIGERFGVIPYIRYKSYLCFYRSAFFFMLPALALVILGWGRLNAMGTQASTDFVGGVRFEEIMDQGSVPGDYFRAVNGYVSLEQTRILVRTLFLHPISQGDEIYEIPGVDISKRATGTIQSNLSTDWFAEDESGPTEAPRVPNAPTQYHQLPPPWLTFDTPEMVDVLSTVTVAPAFEVGEACLERPPPTTKVCFERNKIRAFALKFSDGLCRSFGSVTCPVDWESLQIQPSYMCHHESQWSDNYERDYQLGLCGRVVQPQGEELVMVKEAMRRFAEDGWTYDADKVFYIDVSNDTCISEAEKCEDDYRFLGTLGLVCSGIAFFLVVLSWGFDIYHDWLLRQLQILDEKELTQNRMVRRSLEADHLRQIEAMRFEQAVQVEELEKMFHEQANAEKGLSSSKGPPKSMFDPLPGSVPPVK